MNDLIKMNDINGVQTVNARDLHEYLGVQTRFTMWIKRRIATYGFLENDDYILVPICGKNPQGGRALDEYHLTFDMAKELGMIEKTDRGREIRKHFIEVEKVHNELLLAIEQNNQAKIEQQGSQINNMISHWAPFKPHGTESEVNGKPRIFQVKSYYRSDKGHLVDDAQIDMFNGGE